jgi:hypothetical protein
MKTVKTIILVILFLGGNQPTECQNSGRNNKIKSITISEEKFDMLIKKQYKESETYFDQNGNILEEINYKQGDVTKHFKYQYDADNNKIREEEYDPSGRLIEFSEYKFNNGLRVEKIVYDANKKVKSKKSYTYTTF